MNPIIQTLTDVLRDPQGLVERHDHPAGLAATAPTLLAIIIASGALFGSAVGVHHGGVQMIYAALKLPVLLLLPPLVTLPAIHAAQRLSGASVPWRRLSLAGLVGTAGLRCWRRPCLLCSGSPSLRGWTTTCPCSCSPGPSSWWGCQAC